MDERVTAQGNLIRPYFHNLNAKAHNARIRALYEGGMALRGENLWLQALLNAAGETPPGEWPRSVDHVRSLTEEQLSLYAVRT